MIQGVIVMNKNRKKLKVCLFWHNINSANYGVSALAIAHINMLAIAAQKNKIEIEFDTWGTPAIGTLDIHVELEKRFSVKITHRTFGLRSIVEDILKFNWNNINPFSIHSYDLVFDIGEGDSFTDIYGLKRFVLFSLNKYFALKKSVPLIIAPQTIGPFKHLWSRKIATYLMKKAEAVYVRDHKSSNYLKQMGVEYQEVSDVAFLLPFDRQPKKENSIGINVSGLLWHGGYTQDNQFNLTLDYQQLVLELINGFIQRNKKIYLIGHVISDTDQIEDDYRTIKAIKAEYFAANELVIIAPKFTSPIEAKSFISSMSFFIGSRMHATIGSISAGVATVPLAYSRKFSGVFETINYTYTLDLYGKTTQNDIVNKLFEQFDHHLPQLEEHAKTSANKAKSNLSLYQNFLLERLK